jgi:hypothetical protein
MQQTLIVLQRVLATLFATGLACLAISGLAIAQPLSHVVHRWSAHGTVIFAWLFFPLAIGLRYASGSGSWRFVALISVIFLALLLTSFTGYLGPATAAEQGELVGEETQNRFIVLHMGVLPAVLCLLGGVWLWLAWQRERRVTAVP